MWPLVIRLDNMGFRGRPRCHEQHEADGEQRRHGGGAQCRERRTHHDPGDGGTDGALKHRAHNAFDAVGCEQLLGGQDPGKNRAVRGEEERRRGSHGRCGDREMPDLQHADQSQHRDGRRGDHVDGLGEDDDRALLDPVRGDPADQDERDEGRAPAGRHDRQRHGIVVELDHLKGQHDSEHAVGEDRQRHRSDQQAVLAGAERCEHAPSAGRDHRLLGFELRAHQ
jgi:hypothetical protein